MIRALLFGNEMEFALVVALTELRMARFVMVMAIEGLVRVIDAHEAARAP